MSGKAKRMLNRSEAAAYCGFKTEEKIKVAIRDNVLPAKKHGRDILIDIADLDAYIDSWEAA